MADQPQRAPKPLTFEIATAEENVKFAIAPFLDQLRQNPDAVLRARGPDLAVYQELLRDDQVRSCLQQRRTALTQAEWDVEPASDSATDKEVADFIKQQFHAIGLDGKHEKMHFAAFYGWAVAECMWGIDGGRVVLKDLIVRERDRFGYNYRGDLMLITRAKPLGEVMPPRKFWTITSGAEHDENPYGLGLAHSIYWPVFFKRNGLRFWMVFLEKFGMPTAAAKLPPGQIDQPAEKAKALAVLRAIQADSGIVVPDNMVIELVEAARSGTADYDGLCARMDAAIAKVVLSQTMTTDNGSSRAQAQVHASVAQDVIKADADLLCESMNRTVIRWLTEWNFPGATPPRLFRMTEPPEDLNTRADRDSKIATLGFKPTLDYIESTYGPGWEERELPVEAPAGTGPMGAEFSEITRLARQRVDHRADQQQLVDAAAYLATKYRDLYGARVDQLLNYLEETNDLATFRERVTGMMAEAAPPQAVETVQRASVVARLMGLLRGQR